MQLGVTHQGFRDGVKIAHGESGRRPSASRLILLIWQSILILDRRVARAVHWPRVCQGFRLVSPLSLSRSCVHLAPLGSG